MSERMEDVVEVRRNDLFLLLTSAYRYSVGRMSYIVDATAQSIRRYWPFLLVSERRILLRDVSEDVEAADERGTFLGMEMDHAVWRDLKNWMETHLND